MESAATLRRSSRQLPADVPGGVAAAERSCRPRRAVARSPAAGRGGDERQRCHMKPLPADEFRADRHRGSRWDCGRAPGQPAGPHRRGALSRHDRRSPPSAERHDGMTFLDRTRASATWANRSAARCRTPGCPAAAVPGRVPRISRLLALPFRLNRCSEVQAGGERR